MKDNWVKTQGFKDFMGSSKNWQDDNENDYPLTLYDNFVTSGVVLGVRPETLFFYRSRLNHNENTFEDTSFYLKLKLTDKLSMEFDYQHVGSEK